MRVTAKLACGLSGLALLTGAPALAKGKKDRAQEAVAAARAKVDAATKIGAAGEVPRTLAEAQAALRTAQEDLAGDHKEQAIADANNASRLADTALGEAQHAKLGRAQANEDASADRAAVAERSAADARARADAATADAAAARATPVIIAAPAPAPAPVTTVTTETEAATPAPAPATAARKTVTRKRVVHKAVAHPAAVKTSTTVTTSPN